MKHEDIKDLLNKENNVGKEITVCGWIKTIRRLKNVCFIEINDGTDFNNLQLVVEYNNIALLDYLL